MKYVWVDGKLIPEREAVIPILTHALHYGTSVFEGIRAYYNPERRNLYIFRAREHYVRFHNSAKILGIRINYSVDELINATVELLKVNEVHENVYIRPITFVSASTVNLDIRDLETKTAIIAIPFGHYLEPRGVRAKVVSWLRVHNSMFPMKAKVGGIYVNSVIALLDAKVSGFDEAILLNRDGYVAEGSGENIFIVKDGILHTPPTYDSILEGITRDTVMTIARDLGFTVIERRITREELYTADEVFFVGTAAEVTPVINVDGRVIGNGEPGPITLKLRNYYMDVVYGRVDKYKGWLTPVY
ncbi:branched-chain amino acid transaminase [Vulcanisaeta sp. JCM 14467]|uniref:branched-chain amino acid transaminase n=1 Tax=Vulcanisaeta sp. JCM 14467 TaxID=1295370 RepID=UPI0006D111C0|nr:branched-chain amino acid transaminase [Vulcanisaeta sp. JCM 14467]